MRLPVDDLSFEADLAIAQLRKALDAFARLDTAQALEVLRADDQIDQEFDGLMRKLITFMMEDPRTISASIDLVFVAKAIERVGDHAKNLAEVIIYVVKGTDVRHTVGRRRRRRREMSRILVVEDEAAIAELVAINLRHAGYEVTVAADAESASAERRPRAARPGAARLDAARPVRPGAGQGVARRGAHQARCRSSC